MIVPAYGPNWRYKIPKMAPFLWHIQGIYTFRKIRVAPYNRKRRRRKFYPESKHD